MERKPRMTVEIDQVSFDDLKYENQITLNLINNPEIKWVVNKGLRSGIVTFEDGTSSDDSNFIKSLKDRPLETQRILRLILPRITKTYHTNWYGRLRVKI